MFGNFDCVVRIPIGIDRNSAKKLCSELRLQIHFNQSPHFVRTLGSFTPVSAAWNPSPLPITIMHRYEKTLFAWMHARSFTLRGMRAGGYDVEALRRMLHQVLKALAVMHKSGIAHRDLTGNNVFIDEKNNAFVGDFGYAEEVAEPLLKEKEDAFPGRGHRLNTNSDAGDEHINRNVGEAVVDADDADGFGAEHHAEKEKVPSTPKDSFRPMPGLDGIKSHTGAIPGTSWYAAPEALLCVDPSQYDPRKLDIFALGVTGMGAAIGGVWLFGSGNNSRDKPNIPIVQYFEMVAPYDDALYGDAFDAMAKRFGYPADRSYLKSLSFKGSLLSGCDPKLLDLLKKMLAADPSARPTAEEALKHDYFADLSADVQYPFLPLGAAPATSDEVLQYMRDKAPVVSI